jgi:hypothetical protein
MIEGQNNAEGRFQIILPTNYSACSGHRVSGGKPGKL